MFPRSFFFSFLLVLLLGIWKGGVIAFSSIVIMISFNLIK